VPRQREGRAGLLQDYADSMVAALADTRCIDSNTIVAATIRYDADSIVAAFGSRCARRCPVESGGWWPLFIYHST